MWDFSKKAVALLVVIIIIFVVTTLGFVVQTFNIASSNTATIIAGVMGMLGGFIGAMGAYLASINQMEKQFKKQDRDRLVEINLKNFNTLLMISYDYLYDIPIIQGKFNNKSKGVEPNKEELKLIIREQDRYIKQFKKYESMTKFRIDFKKLYEIGKKWEKSNIEIIHQYHDVSLEIDNLKSKLDFEKQDEEITIINRNVEMYKCMVDEEIMYYPEYYKLENNYLLGLTCLNKKIDELNENRNREHDINQKIKELELKNKSLKYDQKRNLEALEEVLKNNIQIIEDYIEELLSIE